MVFNLSIHPFIHPSPPPPPPSHHHHDRRRRCRRWRLGLKKVAVLKKNRDTILKIYMCVCVLS